MRLSLFWLTNIRKEHVERERCETDALNDRSRLVVS